MSDRKKFFTSGGRALTGLVITAAAATGALLAGTLDLPSLERPQHSHTVDTTQVGTRDVVCAGPFTELGADPSRPDVSVPVGEARVFVAGTGDLETLGHNELDETSVSDAGLVVGTMNSPVTAAQMQALSSPTLRGIVSSSCIEPVNEQWLVGGGSALGETTTLNLGNPSAVAATVQISVFDESGEIDSMQTSGVIVAARSTQVVSLNGYAPNSERIAVRVTSTGAPVSASLGIAKSQDITPVGAATVTSQLRPETRLVVPGVTSADESNHDHPEEGEHTDRFPVLVHAIAPGSTAGSAYVTAIDAEGNRTELGTIELAPKTVGELVVETWPEDATAVIIDADVPIFGGVEGTAHSATSAGNTRDFDWFAPAPAIAADTNMPAAIAQGGVLIVANPGAVSAQVTVTSIDRTVKDEVVVSVPAGAAVEIDMSGSVTLVSSQPVHAGVRFITPGMIAGYPILPGAEPAGELTVYTK